MSIFFLVFSLQSIGEMATWQYTLTWYIIYFEELMLMPTELARIDRTSKGIIWGKICVFQSNLSGTLKTNIKATALKPFLGSKLITFFAFVIDTLLGLGKNTAD